jgi:L-threonylcarbamoyladenylate synthase
MKRMTQTRTADANAIRDAAAVLRAGGLVAFPTETVYGLGANALDAKAVARIFEAKGRPATNPVIVHVASVEQVSALTSSWPAAAEKLAAQFWPGPLSLVVARAATVPGVVTAGGPTVAVRCPAHPVARELIREAGFPLAAPSANRSAEVSPTRAEHVLKSLNGRIDFVLDGGPCPGGIESTVVDVTGPLPRLLRPGLITVPMLENVVGRVETVTIRESIARSPGQMAKHYSPRATVLLAASNADAAKWCGTLRDVGFTTGWLSFGEAPDAARSMPTDPERYAACLYDELHRLDAMAFDRIVVTLPPDDANWAAIRDRLTRAACEQDSPE